MTIGTAIANAFIRVAKWHVNAAAQMEQDDAGYRNFLAAKRENEATWLSLPSDLKKSHMNRHIAFWDAASEAMLSSWDRGAERLDDDTAYMRKLILNTPPK